MERLARGHPDATGILKEALDQAARELLLAQSSDWAFIVSMETSVPYAIRRFREHIANFNEIAQMIDDGRIDMDRIERLSYLDPIFRWIDYGVYL